MDSTQYDKEAGSWANHGRVFVATIYYSVRHSVLQCTTVYTVRRDRQTGGGALHGRVFTWTVHTMTGKQETGLLMGRVFVTAVYDATGKQGAGLFMGALTWKGNLGECLNTLEYRADSSVFSNDVDEPPAQYCSIILLTPRWLLDAFENLVRSFFLRSVQFQHC